MNCSSRFLRLGMLALVLGATAYADNPGSAPTPASSGLSQHSLDKLTGSVLKSLKLNDPAKDATVRTALETYFQSVDAWHQKVDAQLAPLWSGWADARGAKKDEAGAAAIARQIDDVYASFTPRLGAFVDQLGATLSAAQVEKVKDTLTKEPGLKRTYGAFLQIVPTLTDAQKAWIHDTLVVARDQALETLSKKEKIDLFKKQKVKVQQYIEAQGYDWKKSYAAFVAKIKAESGSKSE